MRGSEMRSVAVKTYKTPQAMQRGISRMAGRGYMVQGQSGEFSSTLWITPRWRRKKVVVTFVKTANVETAQTGPSS